MHRIISLDSLSEKALQAYKLLSQVLLEEGLSTTDKLASQVIADARQFAHEQRKGYQPMDPSAWPYGTIPKADHVTFWRTESGALEAVSQPYELGAADLAALARYAQRHNLGLYVRADSSWWFPGTTLAVHLSEPQPQ